MLTRGWRESVTQPLALEVLNGPNKNERDEKIVDEVPEDVEEDGCLRSRCSSQSSKILSV